MSKLIAFSRNFPIFHLIVLLLLSLKTIYDIGMLSNVLILRSMGLL